MIQDAETLAEIRRCCAGVGALRAKLNRSAAASFALPMAYPFHLANAAHNLPLVHAFAVLNDALEQLRNEGKFECNGRELGRLMSASRHALNWQDYNLIFEGKNRRNDVAHRGDLLGREECWQYIDAVMRELANWGVAEEPAGAPDAT